MLAEERRAIEEAAMRSVLLVVCATSTLAVGVNLPVYRVIIRSAKLGQADLDVGRFQQMAGRAGRKGCDERGEAVCIAETESERDRVASLLKGNVEPVKSAMQSQALARFIVEAIVSQMMASLDKLRRLITVGTLRGREALSDSALEASLEQDILTYSVKLVLPLAMCGSKQFRL
eukprot:Polyplicarium_translucidae@DN3998_c0_g1_i1.p2